VARKLFLLAILLAAGSVGVFGFQLISYLKSGEWPIVPLVYVWDHLVGQVALARWLPFHGAWEWLGGVPVTIAGVALAYLVFLASDTLRRR
jgi:hypothetical protein